MLDVIVRRLQCGIRYRAFHGRMHEAVLVLEMAAAQPQQRVELLHGLLHVCRIVDIDPADAHQRVGHEGAQAFVDRPIDVVAGRADRGRGVRAVAGLREDWRVHGNLLWQ